jgi:hypothetical protein
MPRFQPGYFLNQHKDSSNETDKLLDNLTPDQILSLEKRASATKAERDAEDNYHGKDLPLFLQSNPAYRDCAHNTKLMRMTWDQRGIKAPSLVEIEEAYIDLRTAGVLQLNPKAVERENAASYAARADEIIAERKAREFNEDAAYELPLDEVRRRAIGIWRE